MESMVQNSNDDGESDTGGTMGVLKFSNIFKRI